MVTRIDDAASDHVLVVAERAVKEHFPGARVDYVKGFVRSDPLVGREDRRPAVGAPGLSTPGRVRRIAEVQADDLGGAVRVRCRVLIQNYESDERRLYVRDHSINDMPTDTPATREAATTARQNEMWRTRGRDRQLEQKIMQAILEETSTDHPLPPA
jgi:hypothetical protein